ncbi:MAG: transposase [Clostridiaceae bacterium]|nr:transposase [Clostridiaceae bacterium]
MTLISFEQIIEFQQETKLEMILSQIGVSKLASSLRKPSNLKGPKGYETTSIIYALIAMQIEKIQNVKELNIIDGDHISIDSTKLDSYEAAKPKKDIIDDDTNPNWGMKRDTNGNNIRWFGWKLHILCDSKSELPLDILITPTSVYDSTVATNMINDFLEKYKSVFTPSYYAMDSGYDFEYVYENIVNKYNAIPIIAYKPRGSYAPPEGLDEDFDPVCSAGYKLVYWGKDKNYLKFRCPHAVGKCNCPHGMSWCSSSNYGYTLKLDYKENRRLHGDPYKILG